MMKRHELINNGAQFVAVDLKNPSRALAYKVTDGKVYYFHRYEERWRESGYKVKAVESWARMGKYEMINYELVHELKTGNLKVSIPESKLADVILLLKEEGY